MDTNDPVGPSDSNTIYLAEGLLTNGQWSQAFQLLSAPDLSINPSAQNLLAWLYLSGKGTQKNPEKAFTCLKRAIGTSSWPSKANLARMYQKGIGTKKNPKTAFQMYKEAADGEVTTMKDNLPGRKHDEAFPPSNSYLDECWFYCRQWARHLQNEDLKWQPNSPKRQRDRQLAKMQLKCMWELFTNNPEGWLFWFNWFVLFACQSIVTAIIISQLLPFVPGFSFLGTITDALPLGLIFCLVSLFITVSAIITIPLYILCVAVLIYLGCDLPLIGLVLVPLMTAVTKLLSRISPKERPGEDFSPVSLRGKGTERYWLLIGVALILVFDAISVRIVADFFPSLFLVHGWITTFAVASILALSNYLFGKLTSPLTRNSVNELTLAGDWIF